MAQSISDLIKQIKMSELILPEFQRGYVWKPEQVKNYVNSLYLGYPTGHFLIWKTYAPQKYRGDAPKSDNTYSRLILDGQQRLTSVYTLFEGAPPAFYEGEQLYFDLYFDLVNEEFQFYQKSKMAEHPEWIAVTPFLKQGIHSFLSGIDTLPLDRRDLYLRLLSKFNRLDSVRNYQYHLDEVADKPVEEIVRIFNLVNSSGTELSNADLALAQICVAWPEARDTLRAAQETFSAAGFAFGLDFFTRCVSTVVVGNVKFEGGFDKSSAEEVKSAWETVERTLEYLINILRNDAFVDSSENLSTPNVLIPLVFYLSRQGSVFKNDSDKRGFLYWMYLALMWGRYSGSTESNLQADVNSLMGPEPLKEVVNNLLLERGRLYLEAKDLEGQGTRSRFYALAYIAARSRGALDWFTGMKLYSGNLGKSFGLEDHHIFPQSQLYKNGYNEDDQKDRKRVNEIANRAFLTKKANLRASNALPAKYLHDVKAKYPSALAAQFVPDSEHLWEIANYEAFLAERRKLLASGINAFLNELVSEAEPGRLPVQSIQTLLASGESETLEYKSSLRWDYKEQKKNNALEGVILKAIAGFLNGKGGTLLIGVSPNGQILGLQNDYSTLGNDQNRDGFEQKLVNLIGSRLGKDLVQLIMVSFVTVEDKDVCWIHVEPSPKPVYVEDGNDYRFFARMGNTTQTLNAKEMTDYIELHWNHAHKAKASVAGI